MDYLDLEVDADGDRQVRGVVLASAVVPSYTRGIRLGDLSSALPRYAVEAIREALTAFDEQIKGFDMADALLTGVETRTSSPVRLQRHPQRQPNKLNAKCAAARNSPSLPAIVEAMRRPSRRTLRR